MALINCPECGRQISDMAESCIGCGYPLKNMMMKGVSAEREDTRTEMEKLVDEIRSKSANMYVAIKLLREATGMDLKSADAIMRKKYMGATKEEQAAAIRRKRRASTTLSAGTKAACCPECRSISISYQAQPNGEGYVICLSCGERWNI